MSSPSQPVRERVERRRPASRRPRRTRPPRRRRSGSTTAKSSGFSSRSSSAILPPTSTSSARPPRFCEHAELVLDLRAAGDEHERPLDLAEQAAEVLELGEQEQPRVGGQQLRDALGRGVRAVRRAERVVDVEVAAVRELAREGRVVRRLARVEARVLEHLDALVRRAARAGARATGAIAERRVLALRPAEVRADARPPPRRARAAARASAARRGSACRRRRAPSSSGTLRSARTSTTLPATSRVADGARQPHSAMGSDWKSSIRLPDGSRRYATRPPQSGWSTRRRTTCSRSRRRCVDVVDLEHGERRVARRAELDDAAWPARSKIATARRSP